MKNATLKQMRMMKKMRFLTPKETQHLESVEREVMTFLKIAVYNTRPQRVHQPMNQMLLDMWK